MEYSVTVRPLGTSLPCGGDEDLLTALQNAGIELESVCGGIGVCGKCRIHVLEGNSSEHTLQEMEHLTAEQRERGERLACQVYAGGDLVIQIPASSLTPNQRLQLECELEVEGLEPSVCFQDLEVDIPESPGDHGSDLARVLEALRNAGTEVEARCADLGSLRLLPGILRRGGGAVRAVTRRGHLLGLIPEKRAPLGVAVDLGSTKIALFLYDLASGGLLASRGLLNPQVPHGEDIVTRIQRAMEGDASRLKGLVIQGINESLAGMLSGADLSVTDIYEMMMVGNTAMHHLFLELPVEQLARSPYLPAVDLPLEVRARDLGIELNPAAVVYLPPPIAGYVGSDHLAAVAATRLWEREGPCLLMDIGTNTEVALQVGGRIRACSCASGPAFEGGGLSQGMRAGDGAIERVYLDPATGEPGVGVIGDTEPVGICGSGILSALVAMLEMGAVDASGRVLEGRPGVERRDGRLSFILAPPGDGGAGGVAVTQDDVREIQKAKGAIRAGIDALLDEAGIGYADLGEIILAGAFGTFIDPTDALRIALIPPVGLDRVNQVGNAAGAGARSMLLSAPLRREVEGMASRIDYLELSSYTRLSALFAAGMYLSEDAVEAARRRFKP